MKTASKHIKQAIIIGSAICMAMTATQAFAQATLVLNGTSYVQSFDDIGGNGLPDGWTVRTGASASNVGSTTAFVPGHKDWSATTGSFANYASTTANDGSEFTGSEPSAVQSAALNRAPGVRQTGTLGDPGAAFVLRIENTVGMGNFELSLDLLMLSIQTRSTTWTIDYAIGNSPSGFTPLGTYSDPGVFGKSTRNFSFGSALNNQFENVWIRVAALSASTGSGNRDTFAIDNVQLTWTAVGTEAQPPSFLSQPQSRTNVAGTAATFNVSVAGTAPFSYQWKKGNQDLFDDGRISGTATASLTIAGVTLDDAGDYSVQVNNSVGSTNSDPAVLTVIMPTPIVTNIAHLRTKMDPVDFSPTDTTNLYTAEGIVTTPVNLTTPANAQFYMQDSTAGIVVFVAGGANIRPAQGDRVRVTGPLGHFNGLFELNLNSANFTHTVEILSSGNPLPTPAFFNFSNVENFAFMESSVEGSLLVVSNVFLQGAGGDFASGANYNMTNMNGEVVQLRVDTRATDVIGKPIPQFATSIKGVMGQFKSAAPFTGGYQLFLTLYDDMTPGSPPPPSVPLVIARGVGNFVQIGWSASAPGTLHSTESIDPANWQPVSETPDIVGEQKVVTINNASGIRFYRLQE